jgi:ADP-ribosylglycohydrolase
MQNPILDRLSGMALGGFIGDAVAMPAHWYYDRIALRRDYGEIRGYLTPFNPHPDSILWRSQYTALNERGDILRDQAVYWGQRGVHYHQFLAAGENTLNLQLARELIESLLAKGAYDAEDYLARYIAFLLTPGKHRDTYVEECHRKFFEAYARGTAPKRCGGTDIHIGGLAPVGVLCGFSGGDASAALAVARAHVELTHRGEEIRAATDALVRILVATGGGVPLREAILEHGRDYISKRKITAWAREPDDVVIGKRLSTACYLQDAFPASLYLAWKYAGDFESGILINANLGGDNCHRGAVVGALLGAESGASGIASRWTDGLQAGRHLLGRIGELVAGREPNRG